MFGIQGWSRFSPRKFIFLLCVFHLSSQSQKKQVMKLQAKSHVISVLCYLFFLKRPALRGHTFLSPCTALYLKLLINAN